MPSQPYQLHNVWLSSSSYVCVNVSVCDPHQGIDPIHQTRVVEILKDTEGDRRRSRDSLASVKYESGSDAGEEVSMGVEWNGVSTNPLQLSHQGQWPHCKNKVALVMSLRLWTGTELPHILASKCSAKLLSTVLYH